MWSWLINVTSKYCGRLMGNNMGSSYVPVDRVEPDLTLENSTPIYHQGRPGDDRSLARGLRNRVV